MIQDTFPSVTGHVTIELKKDGQLVKSYEGNNIWTNSGRQFLANLIRYTDYANSTPAREDRIAYFGLGTGSLVPAVGITALNSPVSFDAYPALSASNKFLALVDSSEQASETTYTGVTFVREFGTDELVDQNGNPVVLREVGLYTDGRQDQDYAVGSLETINSITDPNGTASFAPMAYKTFEPITKTRDYTLKITWQVRFS